jgi:arylsulfatase I/J
MLPPRVELFDLEADPSEAADLSAAYPGKVAELQARVIDLARSMAPPLFFETALGATLSMPLVIAD